jgi:hypothetical protein
MTRQSFMIRRLQGGLLEDSRGIDLDRSQPDHNERARISRNSDSVNGMGLPFMLLLRAD